MKDKKSNYVSPVLTENPLRGYGAGFEETPQILIEGEGGYGEHVSETLENGEFLINHGVH